MSQNSRWWVMSTGVALAICCWLLADLFWRMLFPQFVPSFSAVSPQPVMVNAPITLFGQPGKGVSLPSAALASGAQLRDWQLLGTIIVNDQALALISKGADWVWVHAGESLPEGFRVIEVKPGQISLLTAQGEHQLKISREQNLSLLAPSPLTSGERSRSTAPKVLASARERVRQNPAEVMKWMRLEPVFDSGQLTGVVISPLAGQEDLYRALGFQANDVLMAINGVPVQNWMGRMGELLALLDGSGVRVQVQRAGQKVEWTLAW